VIRGIVAVVDLSGVVNDTGADDETNARRLRVPALFAVAPGDRDCPIEKMRALHGLVPSRPKRLIILAREQGTHGWDLLMDATGKPSLLAAQVASWVRGRFA